MLTLACLLGALVALRRALREGGRDGPRWRRVVAWTTPLALVALAVAFGPRGPILVKTVGRLVMPLGLVWLALLGAAVAAAWRDRRRLALGFAGLWIALTLAGSGPLATRLVSTVEGRHAWSRPLEAGPFDAVIVLGGGTSETPRGEAQLGFSGDRVMLGARLYHRGRTPLLVTSGSPIAGLSVHDSGRAAARIWRELGVPEEAIVVVEGARTTSEEAALHAREARARGWRRVGLVSSARHLPRALARFDEEGLPVTPLPADVWSAEPEWVGLYDLVPNAAAAMVIQSVTWELVGRAAGR